MRIGTRALGVGIAALMAAATATGAAANDSAAELATGGLVLTKNPSIEMRSEDLTISTQAVRVRYVFANTSTKDVTILVAFPMPDVTIDGPDDNVVVPTQSPTNLLGFATTVDGQPVCYGCGRTGHIRMSCPERSNSNGNDNNNTSARAPSGGAAPQRPSF